MRNISHANIRLVDAGLLLIFLALLRLRSATLVAREMGLTQPAISHALKRLRRLYGDPLFLRRSNGLEPTALARQLEPEINEIVQMIAATLSEPDRFDPQAAEHTLRVSAFDYELSAVVAPLIAQLAVTSPKIRIISLPLSSEQALAALSDGRVDLAIGYFAPADPAVWHSQFIYEHLYAERYVAVARRGHPLFADGLTVESYVEADHLQVSPAGTVRGVVDSMLATRGLARNIRSTVPSLFPALSIVESSELVATVPSRIAVANAWRFNLDVFDLEMQGIDFPVFIVRHLRDARSSLHNWLIGFLRTRVDDGAPVRVEC